MNDGDVQVLGICAVVIAVLCALGMFVAGGPSILFAICGFGFFLFIAIGVFCLTRPRLKPKEPDEPKWRPGY
jgi:hypothetical protein